MGWAPLVSVVIPTYETAPLIREAVDSVLDQTYRNYEIIVVNDGSPDTPELERALEPVADRIRYLKQENRGVSSARNTGIRAARGELIAFLDSDDAFFPHYLERQLSYLETYPDLDVVYPDALIVGHGVNVGRRWMDVSPSRGSVTFEALVLQRCYVPIFALVRRSVFDEVGLFDEALRSSEDFEVWLRVVKAGRRVGYHRDVLVRYRHRPGSLSSDPISMHRTALEALRKTRPMTSLTSTERAAVARLESEVMRGLVLVQAKRAFFDGDWDGASRGFAEFDRLRPSAKTKLVIAALHVAPRFTRVAYKLRDRWIYGASTEF